MTTHAQGKTMIHVDGLTKHYGKVKAVNNISFDVHAGEVLGFLGPNGAGKTTTMKILTSYLSPTSGRAVVAGCDVFDQALEARARIGYLPEGTPLYRDMTVLEYLNFIADVRNIPSGSKRTRRLRDVVEQCGLGDRLGFLIGELSKGLKQRVGLAQAILHEPEVLILDEPTSGLDPNQIVEIRQVIKQIGEKKTVIFSTHIMQEVQATCSRMLIISKGKIAADGKPDELQRKAQGQMSLQVELLGDENQAKSGLESITGVESVRALPGEESELPGGHRFVVMAKSGSDPRAEIFKMATAKGLQLTELHRERASLEDVFRNLTAGSAR
ncbi:MAG TPA: ATP-binding cassette domain-containing protein [Pseudomonadota bacterium]|nr:ATP-binding cassette domain-containing protein [Pseudomonadota bacterium]HND10753.1 ATP-binding cassette domain-containing protein [Pseudomonadota bacterium]HNF97901.1 ATP-binding cassette domain-containing protein [Pseudomonadota bacterium]HNI59964.1 ATP-binding cassette domain-containing protein [Pseudomonadota bacterium]HNK45228.1 ATP-binding cassette domain-containing protein [Pseudomonadota bacterium]